MSRRLGFCGVIEGSVVVRAGETEAEALARAERAINDALGRSCRLLSREGEREGPVVGLEPAP